MRELEKIVQQAQFAHHLEGRGMDRIAAEVAEEIGVLFDNHDIDPGARQEQAGHHSRGAAAGNTAARGNLQAGVHDPTIPRVRARPIITGWSARYRSPGL